MSLRPPEPPVFGTALPRPAPSQAAIDFLALRRSASAAQLHAPGPTDAELGDMLRIAARAPDHGKLAPWRFLIFAGPEKARFVERLEALASAGEDPDKRSGALVKIRTPPLTVAVISRVLAGKIPAWEQELSAGVVCYNLLLAANAYGYGANWITDWYAYDPSVAALIGLGANERVAGYIHIGTAGEAPLERVRPDTDAIIARWTSP